MTKPEKPSGAPIDRLLDIMARLRDPDGGCPWDVEQDFASISPYTIEEAYEVADAIDRGDMAALREELGDLLLQVVFHAQMAREAGEFGFDDIATTISDKMIRRHPHVFAEARIANAADQTRAWEEHKAQERANSEKSNDPSVLADIPLNFPALLRAEKLGKRASRSGFDWEEPAAVTTKVAEEIEEVRETFPSDASPMDREHEIGDLLFACAQLARHLDVNPENALAKANRRFERRFRFIENALSQSGKTPDAVPLAELEKLWERAKNEETGTST